MKRMIRAVRSSSVAKQVTAGLIVTAMAGALGYLIKETDMLESEDERRSALLIGTWNVLSDYQTPEANLSQYGRGQFFENGGYMFAGKVVAEDRRGVNPVFLTCTASANGKWLIRDGALILKLGEFKTRADTYVDKSGAAMKLPASKKIPCLELIVNKGDMQEFTIQELTDTKLHATAIVLQGSNGEYVASRL